MNRSEPLLCYRSGDRSNHSYCNLSLERAVIQLLGKPDVSNVKYIEKLHNYTTFRPFWPFFRNITYFRPKTVYCIVLLTLSWNTRTRLVLDDVRRSRLILISPNDFNIDPVKATYFLLLPIKLHFLRNLYNMKSITLPILSGLLEGHWSGHCLAAPLTNWSRLLLPRSAKEPTKILS